MPAVRLGNPAALDGGRVLAGEQVTEAVLPDNWNQTQMFLGITAPDGVWRNHSGASAPTWVTSTDAELATELSQHYGCPVGDPNEPTTDGAPAADASYDVNGLPTVDSLPTLG